jgi:hypothetical protein
MSPWPKVKELIIEGYASGKESFMWLAGDKKTRNAKRDPPVDQQLQCNAQGQQQAQATVFKLRLGSESINTSIFPGLTAVEAHLAVYWWCRRIP